MAGEDRDDELWKVSIASATCVARGGTDGLDHVESDDTFEREQLEQDTMLSELGLVLSVEPECSDKGDASYDEFENGDPDVRKVRAVGLFTVGSDGDRDSGCDPENDARWDKLKDAIPPALQNG